MAVTDPREAARLRGYPPAKKTNTAPNASSGNANGGGGSASRPKKYSYRYPLARLDNSTDYLKIKVLDYEPVGLNLGGITFGENEEGKIVKNPQKDSEGKITGVEVTKEDIGKLVNVSSQTATERFQKNGEKINGYIYLPIPQNLTDTNSVTWGEDSLDPLSAFGLAFGADALKDPGGAVRKYFELGGAAINELVKDPGAKNALIAAVAGQAYGALGGNVSATGLIARATGQIFNPNMELLFQGVNIRTFSFTFNFVARSVREGEEIKNIIRTLKKSMTPSKTSESSNLQGVFIKTPKVFQLEYRKGNSPHPFLNRFLPMALTNVLVNYTGSNTYATYYDGTPVHITMQLDFQELNPLYTEDYENVGGVGY